MPNVALGLSEDNMKLVNKLTINLFTPVAGGVIATGVSTGFGAVGYNMGHKKGCVDCCAGCGGVSFFGLSSIFGTAVFMFAGSIYLATLELIFTALTQKMSLFRIQENDLMDLNETHPRLTRLAQLMKTGATLTLSTCLAVITFNDLNIQIDAARWYSTYVVALQVVISAIVFYASTAAFWFASEIILTNAIFLMRNVLQKMNTAMTERSFKAVGIELLKLSFGLALSGIGVWRASVKEDLDAAQQTALAIMTVFSCLSSLVLSYGLTQSIGRRLTHCSTFFGRRNMNVALNSDDQDPLIAVNDASREEQKEQVANSHVVIELAPLGNSL